MESLSQIIPVTIPVADYLRDHVHNERAVFPAVESMAVLARSCLPLLHGSAAIRMDQADFIKFLQIDHDAAHIEALNEVTRLDNGAVSCRLITVRKQGKSGIVRRIEHASCILNKSAVPPKEPPLDTILGLEGVCIQLSMKQVYSELIPFKSAYQNINELFVTDQGAIAIVDGGTDKAPSEPLGSPFPLDASFHAACVWGQRFAGIVGFPVHIDRRIIMQKTRPYQTYISRITPVKAGPSLLIFDLWIYSIEGRLCEEVRGLHLKDVSGKKLLPPEWIRSGKDKRLESVRSACRELSLIELATVTKPCEGILSPPEMERFRSMREKRGKSFVAARLALKKLSRGSSGSDMTAPASSITTIEPDGRPACPVTGGEDTRWCTASHDARFAVAAVSDRRIGIDVEEISGRVLKSQRLYMHEEELPLVKSHALGDREASARVWSIKEAVSKAAGMNLADAWQRTRVKEIGREKSVILIDDETHEAIHAVVDGHIFTVIVMKS
ncbi:MAG: hypothetical protein A2W19_14985 [Spirochaetes bacterium RBG_16_49_21]|nr:MAG: hypothetical protein A2W19_14985 [Spirochaetes bacterium RBG_16_49_21]